MQALPTFFVGLYNRSTYDPDRDTYVNNWTPHGESRLGCGLEDFWENEGDGQGEEYDDYYIDELSPDDRKDQKRIRKGGCKLDKEIIIEDNGGHIVVYVSCEKCRNVAGFLLDKDLPNKKLQPKPKTKKEPSRGKKASVRK